MEKITLSGALLVGAGSALGGVARWTLSLWLGSKLPKGLPWGTILVNVSGCLLIGLLLGGLGARANGNFNNLRLLLAVGFLGGYTTFSSLMNEALRLGPRGGALNLLVSLAAGYAAAALGTRLGAAIWDR